jgi:ribonuclease HI
LLHLDDLAAQGISRTHVTRLFSNLDSARITTLDDISPLFEAPIARPTSHPWHRQKGRAPRTLQEILKLQSSVRILHTHFCLPNASVKQRKLLRILLHLLLERVLQSHAHDASYNMQETSTHWGKIQKHVVEATDAYTDGSATKDGTRAGFGINFSGQPTCNVKSRIPGHQTIARAEAYGVLTALMMVRSNINLSIYCDREPLVHQLNRFICIHPQDYNLHYLPERSLVLRILEEIRSRPGHTSNIYVKAHAQDSGRPLHTLFSPQTVHHQTQNKTADQLAKDSLQLAMSHTLVPTEFRTLAPITVLLSPAIVESTSGVIYESNPLKIYQEAYASELSLHYHLRGSWHTHLFKDSVWRDASTSILSSKPDIKAKHFLVQVLGRTLSTFHRLSKIRPRLYPDEWCILCPDHVSESTERLLFDCPFFHADRLQLCTDLITACRTKRLNGVSTDMLRNTISNLLLNPAASAQRDFSAGQLPHSFYNWLCTKLPEHSTIQAFRLGKTLHNILVENYQAIWKLGCTVVKEQHMLFRDRLRVFPTLKPLHEMTDDDYVAFAIAWKTLHPTNRAADSRPVPQSPILAPRSVIRPPPKAPPPLKSSRQSSMQAPIHITSGTHIPSSSIPSFNTLPSFNTPHPIFHDRLRVIQVDGDGNCLFRALLRAAGHTDADHLELRKNCVDVINHNWEEYTHQANSIHQAAPAFATTTSEPFPTKEFYATYMSHPGHWGSELEAIVCAKILQQPLLIWNIADGSQLHPLINYSVTSRLFTQNIIHIIFRATL